MSCSVSNSPKPSDRLFVPPDVRMEQLIQCYNKMNELRKRNTKKTNLYRQTKRGRERTRIANKKYYYKKNNKYHAELNPDGEIGRPPVLKVVEETPESI
jgi:hypothetical protein